MAKVDYEAIRLEKAKKMKHPDWHKYSGWPPQTETPTGEKVVPNRRKKQVAEVQQEDDDTGETG